MNGKLYQRGNVWWVRYTHRGKEHRQSLNTNNRDDARKKLELIISKIRITGDARAKDVRLEELVTDYVNECLATDRRGIGHRAGRIWELHLQPYFNRVKISALGTQDFTEYRRARVAGGASQTTVNRELQTVIASYKLGYRSTPAKVDRMPYIKLTREDNARKTFISEAQRDAIFTAASGEGLAWRVLVEMAYLLGWRKGELLGLTVGSIDKADRVIRLETSKNGEGREVPLTDRLAMLLQQLGGGRPADCRVFPAGMVGGNFERVWRRVRVNAGCPTAKFHDWRRTSARTKRAAGVAEGIVMEIMGWRTAQMFRRYCIVDNADKRKALELVEASPKGAQNPHTPPDAC